MCVGGFFFLKVEVAARHSALACLFTPVLLCRPPAAVDPVLSAAAAFASMFDVMFVGDIGNCNVCNRTGMMRPYQGTGTRGSPATHTSASSMRAS